MTFCLKLLPLHSLLKQLISVNNSRFYRSYYYQNLWTQGFLVFALWGYLPLEQGLRLQTFVCFHLFKSLWGYLPLEQGLRPWLTILTFKLDSTLRVSSIKTRIKTNLLTQNYMQPPTLRVSSIRTRIKTFSISVCPSFFNSESIFH